MMLRFVASLDGPTSLIWLQVTLACCTLCAAYTLVSLIYNLLLHPLRRFPGPKSWAASCLARHFFATRGRLDHKLLALHNQYGEVVRISPSELSFSSERAWTDIYARKDIDLIKDPVWYNCIEKPGQAKSILNAGHDGHARMRKYMSLAFSETAIRQQESAIQGFINLLVDQLQSVAASQAPTDIVKWYNFIMFDSAAYLTIGRTFGCLANGEYHSWVASIFKYIKVRVYTAATIACTGSTSLVHLFAPASVKEAQAKHASYIAEHGAKRWEAGNLSEQKDIISYVLDSLEKEGCVGNEKAEVIANCNFLMRAGSETVATALSGLTYFLLKSPSALKKVVREVRETFRAEDEITFQSTAARLPYLNACIKETLRIYPPGPSIFPRRTPPGQRINIAGYIVPGWISVGVHNLASCRSANNFARPDDFCPERWLALDAGLDKKTNPFAYDSFGAAQVFSMGPRNCIGKGLAYNEMRLIASRVLWNFDLSLCDESKNWDDQPTFVIWQKSPLMCRLTKSIR